jgi:hypothetical protein
VGWSRVERESVRDDFAAAGFCAARHATTPSYGQVILSSIVTSLGSEMWWQIIFRQEITYKPQDHLYCVRADNFSLVMDNPCQGAKTFNRFTMVDQVLNF